jgi:TonB family protein
MKPGILILAALGPLCWPCSSARAEAGADSGDYQPIVIHETEAARYPVAPEALNYIEGRAMFMITVDADGRLADTLAVYYSDPLFEESALYALGKWTFEPARLNGRPVSATKEVDFNFERHGVVVVSQTLSEFVDGMFRREFPNAHAYRAYTLGEIDGKLNAVHVVSPRYGGELAKRVSGTVTLAYYIDEQGRVRMPLTVNDPEPELANLAVDAVKQWRFDPPMRDGRPVLVRVSQSIRFNSPSRS